LAQSPGFFGWGFVFLHQGVGGGSKDLDSAAQDGLLGLTTNQLSAFFRVMGKRWTPERDEELKRHKTAGLTSREIAVLLGSTPPAIQTRARKLRLFSPLRRNGFNGFWAPERDEELKRHEAAGLSASEIAVLLRTTRNAVIGRSHRLRGMIFPSDLERRPRRRTAACVQTSETPIDSTPSQSSARRP
jgi:hypothetical protein